MKIYVFVSMCAIDIIILSVVRVLVVVRSLEKKELKIFFRACYEITRIEA